MYPTAGGNRRSVYERSSTPLLWRRWPLAAASLQGICYVMLVAILPLATATFASEGADDIFSEPSASSGDVP